MDGIYDLAIIGGGINGCGIARDAAGRGLSVYLCEQADLASGTSSAATKLIHGGLRYLEYLEFRLVREALMEREVLWRMAPHIIWPMRFVLPYQKGLRPAWLLRLGLFLYDHLGGRELLPATSTLDLTKDVVGQALKSGQYTLGFEYSDCWVDDARLVVLNARDAANRGATIRTRTKAVTAERKADIWHLTTVDRRPGGSTEVVRARILVNAAGPWVGDVLVAARRRNASASIRLVQGSHIVVPKLYAHDRCYIFQNIDKRIIFVIPYEEDFTLIGTTERDYVGDPGEVRTSAEEIEYLCVATNQYFKTAVTPADVIWTYSGVRPLYDDGASEAQAATRDYVLDLDEAGAPLLSILGGKITTYRRLAQHALDKLERHLPAQRSGPPRLVGAGAAAGRRLSGSRLRGAGQGHHVRLSVARRPSSPAPGSRLWHPRPGDPRRCLRPKFFRPGLRQRSDRGRGHLSDARGMGGGSSRRDLATLEARAAAVGRASNGAQELHGAKL